MIHELKEGIDIATDIRAVFVRNIETALDGWVRCSASKHYCWIICCRVRGRFIINLSVRLGSCVINTEGVYKAKHNQQIYFIRIPKRRYSSRPITRVQSSVKSGWLSSNLWLPLRALHLLAYYAWICFMYNTYTLKLMYLSFHLLLQLSSQRRGEGTADSPHNYIRYDHRKCAQGKLSVFTYGMLHKFWIRVR